MLRRVPVCACALLLAAVSALAAENAAAPKFPFVKGHSWGWAGARGSYAAPEAADSMKKMADTGADWVCIAYGAAMDTAMTTHIKWGDGNPNMVADDEIRRAVKLARDNGLKVILKPSVNCDDSTWRSWIKFFRPTTAAEKAQGIKGINDTWGEVAVFRDDETTDLEQWAKWWKEFSAYLVHHAELAEELHCEMFCLGCEMGSTESFEKEWRQVIGEIRKVYHGQLTYDVNHDGESNVGWWDAVDFISVSAYYAAPPPGDLTEEEAVKYTTGVGEIVAHLRKMRDNLRGIHDKYNKPILFIETGCTPVRGCARHPWAHVDENNGVPIDQQEQLNYYQAMFEVFWDEPWFMGFCWWDWPAGLYDAGNAATNRTFCMYGKPAEKVVKEWYAKVR